MSAPTRQIIVLSRQSSLIAYVLRADVPVGQEAAYKQPGATSPTGNVTDPDLPGLIAGTIAQKMDTLGFSQVAAETGAQLRARIQAVLITEQATFQAQVSAAAPQTFFGAFYNGTVWAASGG